jgi:hypothetical protein
VAVPGARSLPLAEPETRDRTGAWAVPVVTKTRRLRSLECASKKEGGIALGNSGRSRCHRRPEIRQKPPVWNPPLGARAIRPPERLTWRRTVGLLIGDGSAREGTAVDGDASSQKGTLWPVESAASVSCA